MDAKVLPFPDRPKEQRGWICDCGAQQWVLYDDGSVYCPECQRISTVIKVIRRRDYKHVMKDAESDGVDSEELIAAMMKKIEDQGRELAKLNQRLAEGKSGD